MFRESHTPHNHEHHHHHPHHPHHHEDPPFAGGPFNDGVPGEPGPGRGRGRRHGAGRGRGFGPGGPGFGPGGPGFGPGGPRGRRRRPKGAIREAVLSLLAEAPANGYSLMRQISERTQGAWSPSPGSMYPTLAQLVDEGLIVETGTDKGSDFDLTEAGRAYVDANTESIAAVWAEGSQGAPTHAALRESVMALMGVVHQFRFATDEQRKRATEQLDEARRVLYRILGE